MAAAMSANSVQRAHDALLAEMPTGATHACSLCQPGAGTAEKEEVAEVAADVGDERTYSATEHLALLNDAVARETASLTSSNEELEGTLETLKADKAALETEKSELQSKLDVVEGEKLTAEQARDEAIKAHDAYVAELTELAAAEERRATRTAAVKEIASFKDEYFTDERVNRWVGMTEVAFESFLDDLREAQIHPAETAGATGAEGEATGETDASRETAAFTGGTSPTKTGGATGFRSLMAARGHIPAQQ